MPDAKKIAEALNAEFCRTGVILTVEEMIEIIAPYLLDDEKKLKTVEYRCSARQSGKVYKQMIEIAKIDPAKITIVEYVAIDAEKLAKWKDDIPWCYWNAGDKCNLWMISRMWRTTKNGALGAPLSGLFEEEYNEQTDEFENYYREDVCSFEGCEDDYLNARLIVEAHNAAIEQFRKTEADDD